jgi:basic amino acid/polyamine antiporter, APA family
MASAPLTSRDVGLVRGIGPLALAGAFVGMLIGSGIFNVPAPMAAAAGSFAPLAYLACALAMGAVMVAFAEAVSRVPTAGGVAGFVDAAFGTYWGFLVGVFVWMSVVLAAGGIIAAAVDILATVIPGLNGPWRALAILGWSLALALINIRGVGFASRVAAAATSIKLVPLLLFVGVGIWFIEPAKLTLPLAAGSADIGRAAILGIFMFTGLEASLAVSGEVKEPARTIPRAIIFAMLAYSLLCIIVQIVAQGLLGAALGGSTAPLAEAMAQISPTLGLVLGAGAVISMLGWTASDALSSPRQLFALSRGGFLPEPLGRLHARNHTPWVASLVHAAVAAGLAITGSFNSLAVLATLFSVMVYVIGSAAALQLRRADIATAGPPVRIPALPLLAGLGIAAMLWVAAQSTREEAIGITIFIAVVTLLYQFRRR